MIRKLINLSTSTRVISLPAAWIKRNRLAKGSEINMEEVDNRLIVSAKSIKSGKEITIDATSVPDEEMLWLHMDAAYVSGYDLITVIPGKREHHLRLLKFARYFPGLIIYEERKDRIVFKDIAASPSEDIGKILSRIYNINIDMMQDAIEAMKASDWETLAGMKKRDYTINAYISYCLRQLNKFGYDPASKAGILHTYIKALEVLSDKASEFFVEAGKKRIKADRASVEAVLSLYRDIVSLHFSYKQGLLHSVELKRRKLESRKFKDSTLATFFKGISDSFYDIEELEAELNA